LSTEIVSLILDVITHPEKQLGSTLTHCFKFLRAVTLKHETMQKRMFDELDRILKVEGTDGGWENDMANLVAEIFNNCTKTCIEVRPSHVSSSYSIFFLSMSVD
jgi:hypothetical protein